MPVAIKTCTFPKQPFSSASQSPSTLGATSFQARLQLNWQLQLPTELQYRKEICSISASLFYFTYPHVWFLLTDQIASNSLLAQLVCHQLVKHLGHFYVDGHCCNHCTQQHATSLVSGPPGIKPNKKASCSDVLTAPGRTSRTQPRRPRPGTWYRSTAS